MIAIFGCTANPFAMHHVKMVQVLLQTFSRVIIIICGPRPDKESANDILPVHRAAMTDMSLKFLNDPRVSVEYFDLENGTFTRTHKLQEMFAHLGELWHVIGADWVKGGKDGQSKIQREWMHGGEVWQSLNFAVMTRPGHDLVPQDLPPRAKVFHLSESGSSTGIRERVPRHESISGLVVPAVAEYISRYDLYSGRPARNKTNLKLRDLRFKLFWDPRRKEAIAAAEKMRPWEDEDNPNLALVFGGDRTMLHAARKDWPLRIPFFGVNYGRVGYNLDNIRNEFRPEMLLEQELEIYHCPMLYVEMETITRERCSTFGFNDAWVATDNPNAKTAVMELSIDDVIVEPEMIGDGLLVSTAQGSTAYAKSMGAHQLSVETPKLVVAGNNIFIPDDWSQRRFRLLDKDAKVTIRTLDDSSEPYHPMYGLVDSVPYGLIKKMEVHLSRYAAVELAFLPGHGPDKKYWQWQFPQLREGAS